MFLCVNLKLFSLSFVPLLAPNPGDATVSLCGHAGHICLYRVAGNTVQSHMADGGP